MKARILATDEIIDVEKREERVGRIIYVYYYAQSGESFQDYELEFLPDTPEEVTIEGYVARDKNNDLSLYQTYPERQSNLGYWRDGKDEIELPKDSFPEVTWDSSPKRVKITITPME